MNQYLSIADVRMFTWECWRTAADGPECVKTRNPSIFGCHFTPAKGLPSQHRAFWRVEFHADRTRRTFWHLGRTRSDVEL